MTLILLMTLSEFLGLYMFLSKLFRKIRKPRVFTGNEDFKHVHAHKLKTLQRKKKPVQSFTSLFHFFAQH